MTVVLNAYSKAYPTITNRIRASVYLQSDPQAIVSSIIDSTAGHPLRTWSFPGLPRNNYGFSLDEIDGSNNAINNLALFDVVPSEIEGQLTRADEQIRVGTTAGFTTGAQVAVFDGTAGKPNYIGWDITPAELTGRGILVRGLDYSWNQLNGTFTLLQTGDTLQVATYYNIHFNPISNPAGNSSPILTDLQIVIVTTTSTLTTDMFGKKVLVEPSSAYIELTLPAIAGVAQGRKLELEVSPSATMLCVKILAQGGSVIKFLRGNIYILPGESLTIYKYTRAGVSEWRVASASGNFNFTGMIVSEDSAVANTFNKQLLDGSSLPKAAYARLYNEVILNLPFLQTVAYTSWTTGNNKYLYSLANVSNYFYVPDRRGLYERATSGAAIAGAYQDWAMADHKHEETAGTLPTTLFGVGASRLIGEYKKTGTGPTDLVSGIIKPDGTSYAANIDIEVRPKTYLTNKYVLL